MPRRLQIGAPLTPYHRPTFYGGGAEGCTDYPTLALQAAAAGQLAGSVRAAQACAAR